MIFYGVTRPIPEWSTGWDYVPIGTATLLGRQFKAGVILEKTDPAAYCVQGVSE